MDEILEKINSLCGWDCFLSAFDGWKLIISSGSSLEYAKPLVEFLGVSYLSCPTEFSHPKFRLANSDERDHIAKLVPLEETDYIIAIEAETMSNLSRHVFLFVVESIIIAYK